jgi:SecD/SecF fusion protein
MLKRNLWKILLSLALAAWAVSQLIPLQDAPSFAEFAKAQATAKQAEFAKLVVDAAARKKNDPKGTPSEFVALKQIGKERKIDLSQFFPHIRLEQSLKNIEKRNDILLTELLRLSKGKLQLGLDLKGGVAFTLETKDEPGAAVDQYARKEKLQKAIEIIGTRINAFGVAEPVIRPIGDNRIEIQLPGVSTKDNPDVVDKVKAPARLDFRMVHASLTPGQSVETPAGYEVKTLDYEGRGGETGTEELFIKRIPEMTGEMISNSFARPDLYGKPEVLLEFTSDGKKRFAEVTRAIAEISQRGGPLGRLAIVLDGKLYSAPTVREEISGGSAQITGSFSDREAINLANVLNNPLDVELRVMEQYEVGPTLAADAVISAKNAFIVSTLLTIGFMLVFYTFGGLVAAIGMGVNVIITLGVMASIGATLTMPGIAGIVLTLAMSVDSNILIFERMREELKLGKSLGSALEAGFDKAWSAILDSNVTTLLVALIMIWLGTGAVKGFGVTLAIGIFTTMFAAVVVSKLILEFLIHPGVIKSLKMFSVLQATKFDFLKYTKAAVIGTVVILLVGIGAVAYKGKEIYGIDFAGGDMVTLNFGQKVEISELRRAATGAGIKEVNFSYQQPLGGTREVLKVTTPFDQGKLLVQKLQQSVPQAKFEVAGESRIGASVGKEIQWNALKSIVAALIAILVYVAFRFEIGYGIGAVVSTVHDLFMTIGIFVLFDRQFNASMVAAILLIIGYSINDTIVVFDRIREELKLNPIGTLRDIINRSLNLTLSRTIITGGTTLLTAVTLIVTTSGDVNDIAFTLLIGVLTGTFSSLFIATPVFYWWHKGDRKHVEAHHDIAPKYEWQGSSKASE